MISDCNIQNYSIWCKGLTLFAYFEYVGNDFETDMTKMAAAYDAYKGKKSNSGSGSGNKDSNNIGNQKKKDAKAVDQKGGGVKRKKTSLS